MSTESVHLLLVVVLELLVHGVLVFIGLPGGGVADKFVAYCGKYLRKRISKAHEKKKKKKLNVNETGQGKVVGVGKGNAGDSGGSVSKGGKHEGDPAEGKKGAKKKK